MTLRNANRLLFVELVLLVILFLWSALHVHGGTVRILDTANVVHFQWTGTNASTSIDGKVWEAYDTTVYSKPVMLCGSNTAVGMLKADNATNWVEVITNQVQGLNFIGTDYLREFTKTNQPPLPPQ